MIIHIRHTASHDASEGPDQWSIIELQGNLIAAAEDGSLASLDIGSLRLEKGTTPTLIIGPHILEGEVKKLSPPLLILVRSDGTIIDPDDPSLQLESGVSYNVAGIAYQKLIFKDRPKLGLKSLS